MKIVVAPVGDLCVAVNTCACCRWPFEKHSYEIILKLGQQFRGCCLKIFQFRPFGFVEQNHLCNFGREHYEEHFCEIILNFGQWFRRCLKNFYNFVQWSLFVQLCLRTI